MKMGEFYVQGDVVIERVRDCDGEPIRPDPDGAVVLARGEVTGHRHAFYGGDVTMFRANEGDRGPVPELYIGHIKIAAPVAELRHEEHDAIKLPAGTYRVRRQREWDAGAARAKKIDHMTAEQEALLPIYRAEWIRNGESIAQSDPRAMQACVQELYAAHGLIPPVVIVMDSPAGCLIARAVIKHLVGDNLGANLGANLGSNLGANLRDNLRANLRDNLWDNLWDSASLWGGHDVSWLSFYDFPRHLGHKYPPELTKELDATINYARTCGWLYAYPNIAFVSQRQSGLSRDDRGRLHSQTGPAMAFRDGWSVWAWHGVRVPQYVIEQPDTIRIEKIAAEPNAEIRRVMIERYGYARYVQDMGGTKVHEDATGILWKTGGAQHGGRRTVGHAARNASPDEIAVVEVQNGTLEPDGSRRTYFLSVPPTCKTACEAVAWTYGMDEKQYGKMLGRT
jgi:hypothetical protein